MQQSQQTMRRAGVIVGRRRVPWQKLWHHDIEARLMQVGVPAAGAYLWFRVLAGHAQADGALLVGESCPASKREVQVWLARKLGGETWKEKMPAALSIMEELRAAGLVVWGRASTVLLVNWAYEQTRAPSQDAERQRRHRGWHPETPESEVDDRPGPGPRDERIEAPEGARDETPVDELGGRCSAPSDSAPEVPTPPPSAASTSTPTSTPYGFDRPPKADRDRGVTCHAQSQSQKVQSRTSISTSTAGRGQPAPTAAEGGGVGTSLPGAGCDIYALDPVDAAMLLTGDRGQWARRGFARKLDEVGPEMFRQALGEFRQARQDGIQPRTTAGGMLHGIINTVARGRR